MGSTQGFKSFALTHERTRYSLDKSSLSTSPGLQLSFYFRSICVIPVFNRSVTDPLYRSPSLLFLSSFESTPSNLSLWFFVLPHLYDITNIMYAPHLKYLPFLEPRRFLSQSPSPSTPPCNLRLEHHSPDSTLGSKTHCETKTVPKIFISLGEKTFLEGPWEYWSRTVAEKRAIRYERKKKNLDFGTEFLTLLLLLFLLVFLLMSFGGPCSDFWCIFVPTL